MPALVVVVCPPGPLTAVGDALADWAATDLLQPFLWVETSAWSSGAPPRGQTPALLLQGGRTVGTTVEQALTTQPFDRVRLAVLVPALGGAPGVSAEIEHAIHQAVLGTSAVGRVDLIRLVVTRPDSGPVAADLAREGWHNLIVAPEESRGPGLGQAVLPAATDPIEVAPAAAACLAGVAGLWQDLAAGPLDNHQPPFGRTLRLVRSWYRNLDATAVADQVRAGLLSLEDGVPLPRQHGSQAVYIDDSRRAAKDMADAVLGRHASLFVGERVAPAAVRAEKVGIWEAIKMLFGFIAASIAMAPMKWYSLVIGDVGSAVAGRVQQFAFGTDPSQYAVVHGELAGGAADWRRVGQVSAHLDQLLHQSGPRPHEIAGDFSAVWENYIEFGLTLMDAGDRPGSTPIQVGTDRGVLRQMSDCVPAPTEAFTVPPRIAAAIGGISEVRAADPLGQHTLAARLRQLGGQPSLARDAETTLRDLESWQERTKHSYAAYVGAKLAQGLMYTSQEVSQLMQKTAGGTVVDTSNAHTQARQKKIAAWMRAILFSFVGLVIVLAVLTGIGVLTWWGALLGAGAGVLVWLIGSFVLFVQGQRDLFRDLNRSKAALSQTEADHANLRTAVRDLHRQTAAYGQFLEWTRVLGVLLHAPFGDATRSSTTDVGTIEAGLPLNTRVGRAEADAETTAEVVGRMRRDLYQIGWLSRPWQATLADAGARLGTAGHDISAEPGRMFAQRAGVSESYLTAWADELERGGVGTASGEQLWQHALQRLGQPDYRSRLVSRVIVPGRDGAPATTLSEQEFMAGVGEQRPPGKFDSGVLARETRLAGRDGVTQVWPLERFAGLDRRAVLVELGEGLPDYTFDLGERIEAPAAPAADRSLIPPDPFAGQPDDPAGSPVTPRPPASAPNSGWVF